jgi:hypothetical protein
MAFSPQANYTDRHFVHSLLKIQDIYIPEGLYKDSHH